METIEYFNREKNVVCIGTFERVTDIALLEKGQLFIVPPDNQRGNGKAGCCEGRTDVAGYGLPIALYVKNVSGMHVNTTKGYGSWAFDCCFIEKV